MCVCVSVCLVSHCDTVDFIFKLQCDSTVCQHSKSSLTFVTAAFPAIEDGRGTRNPAPSSPSLCSSLMRAKPWSTKKMSV